MNELVEYIKNKKGQRIGVVVARPRANDMVGIGWSLCRKTDIFDQELGLKKARGRTDTILYGSALPHTVLPYVEKMTDRAERYYKKDMVKLGNVVG